MPFGFRLEHSGGKNNGKQDAGRYDENLNWIEVRNAERDNVAWDHVHGDTLPLHQLAIGWIVPQREPSRLNRRAAYATPRYRIGRPGAMAWAAAMMAPASMP